MKFDTDKSSVARAEVAKKGLGKKVTAKLGVDTDVGSFARARAATALLVKESNRLDDVFHRSSLSIGQQAALLTTFLPIVFDVAGALGALTASLGAATAGLAALGTGAASAAAVGFGGITAVVAPAIKSLQDLFTAQKAASKAQVTGAGAAARSQASSAQTIKSAHDSVAQAARGVTQAEEQLQAAQEDETAAQKALTLARQDAVRQLQDMQRAAIEGKTAEDRAQLSLRQAQQNLRELQASGTASALDLQDAELSVVEARQNVRDVTIQANRDQQDYNKAQKKGIDQMPQVVAAQRSLDDAVRSVHDAQTGVADAHRQVADALQNLAFQQKQANEAAGAGATQLAALQRAERRAGPAVVRFADNLHHLSRRWRDLTESGRNEFFSTLTEGIKRTQKFLPQLARSANRSIHAFRIGFDNFLDRVTGPEFRHFIDTMTRTFAKSLPKVGTALGNIGIVLERIAIAVAPDVVRMARGFRDMTDDWVKQTRNAGELRDTIHSMVNQANAWRKLIGATADLFIAVLVPGAKQGKEAVQDMTAQLQEWTQWVNAHPKQIRDFFKEALKTTGQLAETLLGFLPQLFQISQAMQPINRAILSITRALNSIKIGNISALTVLIGSMLAVKVGLGIFGAIDRLITLFRTLRAAAAGAAAAETAATTAGAAGAGAGAAGGVAGAGVKGALEGLALRAGVTSLGGLGVVAGLGAAGAVGLAGAFTSEGGLLGKNVTIWKEAGGKLVKSFSDGMRETAKKIPKLGIEDLTGERAQLKERAKGIGKLAALGVDEGMVDQLQSTNQRLQDEITSRIKGLRFGDLFSQQLVRAKHPVGAATKGLIEEFGKLNNASRRTFFENVHQYVQSMVRTGQISKRQGQRIEDFWKGVRRREVTRWDRFTQQIEGFFKGILRDLQGTLTDLTRIGQDLKFGTPRQKRRARRKLGGGAEDLGAFLGRFVNPRHGQHGGIVTPQGIVPIQGFQHGGLVTEHGVRRPGSRDKIPALLEVGELVIPKKVVDSTRRSAKAASLVLTEELGKGYKKVSEGASDLAKKHKKSFEKLRDDASKVTRRFRRDTTDDFSDTNKLSSGVTDRMRENVTKGFGRMRERTTDATKQLKQGVSADFQNTAGAVRDGLSKIADMTNKALKALGVKTVNFGVGVEKGGGDKGHRRQTGGLVVPGTGTGDSVPVHAMVEPGEVLAVLNRKAAKRWMEWNDEFPRFQRGGMTKGGGLDFALGPYTIPPIKFDPDHAGGNSHVHISAFSIPWLIDVGRKIKRLGNTVGEFQPTKFGNPGHFGPVTTTRHAHYPTDHYSGHAIDVNSASGPEDKAWEAAIARVIKTGKGAVAEKIARVLIKGPDGPLKDIPQAIADKVRGAANRLIARKAPTGGAFDFGSFKGPWVSVMRQIAKARGWSFSDWMRLLQSESGGDPTAVNPQSGAFGLGQFLGATKAAYAKYGATSKNPVKQIEAMAKYIADRYGTPSKAWAFKQANNYYRQGGIVAPFVGGYKQGGMVPSDGLGYLHQGEMVMPKLQTGGTIGLDKPRFAHLPMVRQLLSLLSFPTFGHRAQARLEKLREFDKHHKLSNKEKQELEELEKRKQAQRTRSQLARGGSGAKQIARAYSALAKFGPDVSFGKKARQRLRELRRDDHLTNAEAKQLRDLQRRQRIVRTERQIRAELQNRAAVQTELADEFKELKDELKEHNKLARTVRANEKAAWQALANLMGAQIGHSYKQQSRQAAAGSAVRY